MKLTTVAKEAFNVADEAGSTLEGCLEAAVQAVRKAVLKECSEICADQSLDPDLQDATYHMGAMDCALRLKAMK